MKKPKHPTRKTRKRGWKRYAIKATLKMVRDVSLRFRLIKAEVANV